MRSTSAVLAATAALTLTAGAIAVAGAASADEGPSGPPPVHGHMLVLGLEFGPDGPTFRKCIDIAAGKALPVHVHHDGLHAGTAGDALRRAGHFPVPTAPLTRWSGCADLEAEFGR